MTHRCHAVNCKNKVPPKMFMCLRHWQMLSGDLKNQIWKTYRAGQENDKNPSAAYLVAASNAKRYILKAES